MRRNLIFKLIIVSITLILLVFSGEGFLRIRGDFLTYAEKNSGGKYYISLYNFFGDSAIMTHRPYQDRTEERVEFDYPIRTNREGIKDVDHTPEKDSGLIRIIGLGDSFAEGVGAPSDSNWIAQLEGLLRTQCESPEVEMIRGGVSGSDVFFCYMLLRQRLLKYDPDVVILNVNTTDLTEYVVRGGMERFQPDGSLRHKIPPINETLYRKSRLFRFYVHRILGRDFLFLTEGELSSGMRQGAKEMVLLFDLYRQLAKQEGFRLMIVFQPMVDEMKNGRGNPPSYPEEMEVLVRGADSLHIPFVDLMPCFVEKGMEDQTVNRYFWPIDRHFNSRGYGLFAECIYEKVCGMISEPLPENLGDPDPFQ
jgi:lysophospholipase L1-like esterase